NTNVALNNTSLTNLSGNSYLHLYQINQAPNSITVPGGINEADTNNYFGIFASGNYDLAYNANDFAPTSNARLIIRSDNSYTNWSILTHDNVSTSGVVSVAALSENVEFRAASTQTVNIKINSVTPLQADTGSVVTINGVKFSPT